MVTNLITTTKLWIIGDAVALDELGNAMLLNGDAHETISAHCGAQITAKQPCLFCSIVCKILGIFWPNHCINAWKAEEPMIKAAHNLVGEKD